MMTDRKITLAQARKALGAVGMKITRTEWDDHRVTFAGMTAKRAEEVAYYTKGLADALTTGLAMAMAKKGVE